MDESELKESHAALLAACKLVMAMLEDGRLVRDIRRDGDSDWSLRLMSFVSDLQTIQCAIMQGDRLTSRESIGA